MKEEILELRGRSYKCRYQKYKRSKNLRLSINKDLVVRVTMPYYAPYLAARVFVKRNMDWIETEFDLLLLRKSHYYYLGKDIRVRKKIFIDNKNLKHYINKNVLYFNSKYFSSFTETDLYNNWLREEAQNYIPKRVRELSNKYNFQFNSIYIKDMRSRWGSCSSKKNLSFNLKLMYFNYDVIDYVIIHELCHLKQMDHSKKFWKLVEGIIPNYKIHQNQLSKVNL